MARRVPTIAPTTTPTISASTVVGPMVIASCSGLVLKSLRERANREYREPVEARARAGESDDPKQRTER